MAGMRFPTEAVLLTVLAAAAAWAQEQPPANPAPPMLENSGKPMVLPFRCTEDDIQWAGMSCSADEPCPVYLELAAVESAAGRVFAAGNIHSSAVTLYSVLLASEDAGHTWREAYERIRGASLDRIQFLDAELGWTSGQALSPLPQDPFLLVTSDGGKTWRQRVIFTESRVGSIQQFQFSAKDSGSLIIDRGPGSEGGRAFRVACARRWPYAVVPPRAPAGRALGFRGLIFREARGVPAVTRFHRKIPQIGRRVD